MEAIKLNLVPSDLTKPICHASQFDDGREIMLMLYDGQMPYVLSNEEIELDVKKLDGNIVTTDLTVESGKNYVIMVTTEQMCAIAGRNNCELKVQKDGKTIYSKNFYLAVEESATAGGIESESEINNLETQIENLVANQYDSENVLFDNTPTEAHGTGYTVTSAGIKAAIDGKADASTVNAIRGDLYKKYGAYVAGSISATGAFGTSANWVRTDFISVDEFYHVYKPLNVADRIAFYSAKDTATFIAKEDYSQNVELDSDLATQIHTTYPTAKFVVMGLRKYSGGTQVAFVPADVDGTGFVLTTFPTGLVKPTSDIVYTMVNQYFSLENKTLTSDVTMTVLLGNERFKNMLVKSDAMYSGSTAPTIQFGRNWKNYQGVSGQKYTSPLYEIGAKGNYKYQEWRVPQWISGCDDDKYCSILLTIPSGTTLYLKSLSNEYSDMVSREGCGINLNAHGSSGCGAPINTLYAFTMAAKLGYKYCITIPKVTSDGVYVCLHDDTSIQATARNDDGTEIAAQYRDRPVSDFTYAELLQFDFGIKTGVPFKGARIPLLEDYFKICSVSGMHPMLSVHPDLAGHWNNIKAMAKKYGVLEKLNIKGSPTNLPAPMSVLGDEIESYTLNRSVGESVISTFNTLLSTYNITKAKKVIEYAENVLTDALIAEVLSNGFVLGAYNIYDVSLSYARVKELIEKGATEFTENFNCCVGLNWL